ncbi:transposase [Dorea longicatena]|uniref:transposase n=1 Tax=Dorea longicatena TaxID=88431 RepID=UPI003F89024D
MLFIIHEFFENKVSTLFIQHQYETYNIFANIQERGLFYLIRIKDTSKKGSISGSLSLPVSCEFDEEIELIMTRKQKFYKTKGYKYLSNSSPFDFLDSENLFYTLHLRLTQFQLENGVYECIASNLDKEEFPPEKIKELYHMRWGIETSFRELKYTIGLTNLHSKNVEYICQEIYAKLILYNFCEIILANIILEERNRKYTYQLNYTMAIQICRHYLRQTFVTIDVEGLIKKELSPQRPHRQYQRRVIKKRWVSFAYRIG